MNYFTLLDQCHVLDFARDMVSMTHWDLGFSHCRCHSYDNCVLGELRQDIKPFSHGNSASYKDTDQV